MVHNYYHAAPKEGMSFVLKGSNPHLVVAPVLSTQPIPKATFSVSSNPKCFTEQITSTSIPPVMQPSHEAAPTPDHRWYNNPLSFGFTIINPRELEEIHLAHFILSMSRTNLFSTHHQERLQQSKSSSQQYS